MRTLHELEDFSVKKLDYRTVIKFAGIIGFFSIAIYKLDSVPPLWWDEGWTLATAAQWVEHGHYGLANAGELSVPGLSAHFPVVALVALSFRLFGIGPVQGRLPFVLLILGSFLLLYLLGLGLFGRKTALAAVLSTLLLPISDELNPALIGRQALGEPAMLFFALLGYFLFWKGLTGSRLHLAGAALAWGAALTMKVQIYPFWLASIALTLLILLWKRQTRLASTLALAGIGTYVSYRLYLFLYGRALSVFQTAPSTAGPAVDVLDISGYVPDLSIRLTNLQNVLAFAWWVVLGLALAAWAAMARLRTGSYSPEKETVRLLLLTLAASWLGWYLAFGMLWLRYLFPVVFIGSLFAAEAFERLTHGFDLRATLKTLRDPAGPPVARILRSLGVVTLAGMTAISVTLTIAVYFVRIFLPSNDPAAAAAYIDAALPAGAIVETYDPEVIFLSSASFHFPPDHVHVQLIRRAFLDPAAAVDYDPLAADPDYLLVGPFSGRYALYAGVIAAGEFELETQFPGYTLYRRAAP